MKKFAIGIIVLCVLIAGFYFFWLPPRYTVPILTYHSFDHSNSLLSVSPENFEKQMKYLKDKHFSVISFDELVLGIKNNKKFPRNTVVITIDDGYKNNYTYAYPALKKYGFPAIIFLIGHDTGIKGDYLSHDEIREMLKYNISFGAHTRNHTYLPSVEKPDTLWEEIAGSKKDIEARAGKPVDYFCYPVGGYTRQAEAFVKKAGYIAACTTNRGRDKFNRDNLFEINRISMRNVDPYFSFYNLRDPIRFRAQLSGYYNILRKTKSGF